MMRFLLSYINITRFSRGQKIHFFINISIGIIITIFFHFLEHTDWGEDTINKAFDFVIRMEAEKSAESMENLSSQREARKSDQLVFVEIDYETYRKWGNPLITPRAKLAEVVKTAYEGGARLIVFDILFEHEDCRHPGSNDKLRNVLQDMTSRKAATKVIFPLRIGHKGDIQRNLYEDLIENNPHFYVATANISGTAMDRMIRYWVPFEYVGSAQNHKVLWNMSLLAAILSEEKEAELREFEKTMGAGNTGKSRRIELDQKRQIVITSDRDDIYRNRIRFFLLPKDTLSAHQGGSLFETLYKIDEVTKVTFKDKIVIIGNSSPDIGDTHPTPVGNLAGMFIIGNATNTILLGIQPLRSPTWLNILIEAVVIVMAAFLFIHLRSFLAYVIGSIILILTLGVFGYYYFLHTGVYLNFIFAVLGMSFHRTIASIENLFEKEGEH